MAEEIKGFAEHFSAFKRHWKMAVITFSVIFIIGIGVVLSLKDVYRSTAYILIKQSEIPEELLRSTITDNSSMMVTKLNETILTINYLAELIERFNLYPEQRKSTPVELLTTKVKQAIKIEFQSRESVGANGLPRSISVGFTLSFEDTNPKVTQEIVQVLVDRYLEENLKLRAEQTTDAADFLGGQVSKMEDEIAALEATMAEFKLENADTLPQLTSANMNMLTRIDQELRSIETQLRALETTRINLEAQLGITPPVASTRLPDGSTMLSPAEQLKSMQTQLAIYQSRYSDDHPDVIRTKRDIESIRSRYGLDVDLAETAELLKTARSSRDMALQRYTPDHPDVIRLEAQITELQTLLDDATARQLESKVTPDNPAYVQLQASLNQVETERAAMLAQQEEWRRRLANYESRVSESPFVANEYAALARKLDAANVRLMNMRNRQFSADIGETLETNAKGEQLILIEPPRLPLKPFKPDRQAILALAFLFAIVCGLSITQVVDVLDHSIRSGAAIANVQGTPPLVEIPYIYNEAETAHARAMRKAGLLMTPVVAVVLAVIVHFTLIRLDVIFYAALQRLGL